MNRSSALERGKSATITSVREKIYWALENLPAPLTGLALMLIAGNVTANTLSAYEQLIANPTPIVRSIESFDLTKMFPATQELISGLINPPENHSVESIKKARYEKVAKTGKVATTQDIYYGHKLCLSTTSKGEKEFVAKKYSCGDIIIAGLGADYRVGQFGGDANEILNKDVYEKFLDSASKLGVRKIVVKYNGWQPSSEFGPVQQIGETTWNSSTHLLTVNMREVGGIEGPPDGRRAYGMTIASNLVLEASLEALREGDLEKPEGATNASSVNWKRHTEKVAQIFLSLRPEDGIMFSFIPVENKLD